VQYCPLMPGMSQSDGALAEGALADSALAGGQPVDGPLVAGLDIGTTAVKAVMVDDDGRIVSRSRVASRLAIGPDGSFEHDALASWWEAPRSALALALAGRRPRAVAVSAMMPSVAAVDTDGRPLGPGLLYGDRRPRSPRTALSGDPTASDEMALLCGWVAGRHPAAAGYWPAQAVANASLGGVGVTDLASAFAAGPLFGGSGWDEAACEDAGFPSARLPRVAVFGEAVGSLAPGLLAEQGADEDEVILGAGSVDGMCEQLVAGTVNDGDVLVALGSTLVVWLTVPGWPEEVPGLWRAPHLAPGMAMLGGASNAGGMWADWVDRVLRPGPEEAGPPDSLRPDSLRPDSLRPDSLRPGDVPIWWPWAKGERVPWHDRELRVGLAGADISHGPQALRRGAYEATGFVARYIVERAATCGTRPGRFVVSGGGTSNRAWLQALADVLGHAVIPMAVPEGAALGAAWLARMAAGLESSISDGARWARWSTPVEPRPEWAEAAARRYARWSEGLPPVHEAARPGCNAPS
jgi:xylulokinase